MLPVKKAQLNTLAVETALVKMIKHVAILRFKQRHPVYFKDVGAYQKVDSAAHAVIAAVIAHHGAVVKETNEESLHQGDKVLHLWLQRGFLCRAVQQAGREAFTS